ncbi:MAG TPA: MgtC/SapB family protein [Vicinamibacterales bacterium]|jgi:putative Mg2+ transporter-C (MgtC) family protein|nr:MgtC/SapB family protein [Vicinamibacterales bacterium]
MSAPVSDLEVIQRLLLAAVAGGVIGAEREFRRKSAGFRTNILIAMGSALFTMLSETFGGAAGGDTRIAAQIVTGIGFLGAGAIIRTNRDVHGLTTAATVWVNAALGMAAGGGEYHMTLIAAAITLVVLLILAPLERGFERWAGREEPPG